MTVNRAILLIVVALIGAFVYWHFSAPGGPRPVMKFLDRPLACFDKTNQPVGTMQIASADNGNTLTVISEGASYTLNDAGGEESYRNGQGQTLAFGDALSFSGFFTDKHGHCG